MLGTAQFNSCSYQAWATTLGLCPVLPVAFNFVVAHPHSFMRCTRWTTNLPATPTTFTSSCVSYWQLFLSCFTLNSACYGTHEAWSRVWPPVSARQCGPATTAWRSCSTCVLHYAYVRTLHAGMGGGTLHASVQRCRQRRRCMRITICPVNRRTAGPDYTLILRTAGPHHT